jgi:lysophospholipase L1-like esterase
MIKLLVLLFLCLLSMALVGIHRLQAEETTPWFEDDSRWVLIGDSITHDGRYVEYLKLFTATRFPDRKITLINAGISGDSAGGALRRYEWDIAPAKADRATIMLGMNDVGRHNYSAGDPTPEILAKRKASLGGFHQNLTSLVARLKTNGVRVTLITPTPYDDTAEMTNENLPGCNAGLAELSAIVRDVAEESGSSLIDVHTPMTDLNHEQQKQNPAFTLIGNDRVHPGPEGHMVLTALLLEGLGAPKIVSDISIDAAELRTVRAENAEVTTPRRRDGGGVEFRVRAGCLPFPVSAQTKSGMALAGFSDKWNRETLQVTGLAPGDYELLIDGEKVATFPATELATGIRLDGNHQTPQHKQAARIATLVSKWFDQLRIGLRTIAMVEHGLLQDVPHPVAFADVESRVREKLAAEPDPNAYMAKVYQRYLDEKPREAETINTVSQLEKEIREAAVPGEHVYAIIPAGAKPG